MQTRLEMEAELQKQLRSATNSNIFPSDRLTSLVQNSYVTATTIFKWLALARAKTTSTTAKGAGDDDCYYNYPDEFRTNTVFRVEIDGKEYNRKSFESYRDYRNRNPIGGSSKRIFSNYQRFIFVSPDTSVGTDNMDIWGIIQAPELSTGASETIFSNNADEGNMAVVKLAKAVALESIKPDIAQRSLEEGMLMLARINESEWEEYKRDQQLDTPLFAVPDFYGKPMLNGLIGQFNYDPEEH